MTAEPSISPENGEALQGQETSLTTRNSFSLAELPELVVCFFGLVAVGAMLLVATLAYWIECKLTGRPWQN